MSTSTSTRTITATHTATYLTDAIFGSLGTLLAHLGLGSTALTTTWATKYAPAIATWIRETSLALILHGVVWGCGLGLISVSGRVP